MVETIVIICCAIAPAFSLLCLGALIVVKRDRDAAVKEMDAARFDLLRANITIEDLGDKLHAYRIVERDRDRINALPSVPARAPKLSENEWPDEIL